MVSYGPYSGTCVIFDVKDEVICSYLLSYPGKRVYARALAKSCKGQKRVDEKPSMPHPSSLQAKRNSMEIPGHDLAS